MKTDVKKCLFGGALIGAGLCSSATAADVNWTYGYANALAYDAPSVVSDIQYLSGSGWNATAAAGTVSAHTIAGTFGLDMATDGGSDSVPDFSYAYSNGYFNVATDTSLLISWDVESGYIRIFGSTDIISTNFTNESGSFEYTFLAGESYRITSSLRSTPSGSPSTISMTQSTVAVVPLPPAALGSLAMLAGLGAYRRVRRQI